MGSVRGGTRDLFACVLRRGGGLFQAAPSPRPRRESIRHTAYRREHFGARKEQKPWRPGSWAFPCRARPPFSTC